MQSIKKIKTSSTLTTASEKIVDLLSEIKEMFETEEIIQDIEWCIDIISSNKVYETTTHGGGGVAEDEWLRGMGEGKGD